MNNYINSAIENIHETDVSPFWWSKESFKAANGEDFLAFELFDSTHLSWLAVAVLIWLLGVFIYSKLGSKQRRIMQFSICAVFFILEIICDVALILTDQWHNSMLPLHFCSINMFVCLYYAIKPTPIVADFLYAACLPGALFALITPAWQLQPVANFFHLHSSVLHILLVLFPILLFVDGFRPNVKNLWKLFLAVAVFAVPMYFLNIALGTNFFFLNGTDNIGMLTLLDGIFPDYRIGLLAVIAVLWIVMFLPWFIAGKCKKNKAETAA